MESKMKKLTKKAKIIFSIVAVAIILLIIIILMNVFSKKNNNDIDNNKPNNDIKEETPTKKLQILDLDSNSRSYAVMINNHATARAHHAGL